MIDIEHLRELLADATPGPWRTGRSDMESYHLSSGKPFKNIYLVPDPNASWIEVNGDFCESDAALIVAAVNALPELLDEIERLRQGAVQ